MEQTDPATIRSINNLPDLGVKVPETEEEKEKMRQAVVAVVKEIQKPDNFEGFKTSVIEMFSIFGIKQSTDKERIEENNARWERQYKTWQKLANKANIQTGYSADIEIHGVKGSSGNILLDTQVLPGGIRVTGVSPGACSIPDITPASRKFHLPERNFYRTFEEVIGVDPLTKSKDQYKNHPELLNDKQKLFYVIGDGYKRIPFSQSIYKAIRDLGFLH